MSRPCLPTCLTLEPLEVREVPSANSIGSFDASTGTWYLRSTPGPGSPDLGVFAYGAPGWVGVTGDWDREGTASIGVFDPSSATWYLRNRNSPGAPDLEPFRYGAPGWKPVVGDWDGDGRTSIGVFDPAMATWYLRNDNSPGAPDAVLTFGAPGWLPVAGDWDGKGGATVGVVDPSTETWYLAMRNAQATPLLAQFAYGGREWQPVAGDWDGNGTTTPGVLDPAGVWYLRNSNSLGAPDIAPFAYGRRDWQPIGGKFVATDPALAPGPLISYKTFQGDTLSRRVWEGQHLAFLTEPTGRDARIMTRIVNTFDRAWEAYQALTGKVPTTSSATTYNGRGTVAVVGATCGAGCGYLGFSGIEIMPEFFDILYQAVESRNEFDQVLFYELGRNFWFYTDQLEYKGSNNTGSITTGYAVFMRYVTLEAAGVEGAPTAGVSFATARAVVEGMIDTYLANPALNWGNTLAIGQGVSNPLNFQSTDLFASFLFRLRRDFGGNAFLSRLWREVAALPVASSTQDAVDNFIRASSKAAGLNLAGAFTNWRWPVSDQVKAELARLFPG